jgi:hypothetical protein
MRLARALTVLFVLGLGVAARAGDTPPVDARTELQAAIDILKTYHMNRDKVDWAKVSADAFAQLGNGTKAEDAYPAINGIIATLGESHTILQSAATTKAWTTGQAVGDVKPPYWAPPESHLLVGNIGFISLHGYIGTVEHERDYANGGRAALQRLAAAHVCRFIVDLRANTGGTNAPMMNAADALLGGGTLGYWQFAGAKTDEPWTGTAGQYESAEMAAKQVGSLSTMPVAVLLGGLTASAGEFTAIAFEGRPNTRFFGESTYGHVSGNHPLLLPDGARITVSVGYSTDRLHRLYRSAIVPDEATPRGQPTLDAAIAWLKRQPCPKR